MAKQEFNIDETVRNAKPEKLAQLLAAGAKGTCEDILNEEGVMAFLELDKGPGVEAFKRDLGLLKYLNFKSESYYSVIKECVLSYLERIAEDKARFMKEQDEGKRSNLGYFENVHPISAYQRILKHVRDSKTQGEMQK